MRKSEIALIADLLAERAGNEQIFMKVDNVVLNTSSWKHAFYHAIILSERNENTLVEWEENYNQWNISHLFRGNIANAKSKNLSIVSVVVESLVGNDIKLLISFSENGAILDRTLTLSVNHFTNVLWENNNRMKTILSSQDEALLLFDLIRHSFLREAALPPANSKFGAFLRLLNHCRALYLGMNSDLDESFIETVLGAGLFYLPFGNKYFYGYISFEALLNSIRGGTKGVKDHILPRKQAAKSLLSLNTSEWTVEEFENWYMENMQFMFVTSAENRRLVNYYESHDTYNDALANFNIRKFPVDIPFTSINELANFINHLLGINYTGEDITEVNDIFMIFRNNQV